MSNEKKLVVKLNEKPFKDGEIAPGQDAVLITDGTDSDKLKRVLLENLVAGGSSGSGGPNLTIGEQNPITENVQGAEGELYYLYDSQTEDGQIGGLYIYRNGEWVALSLTEGFGARVLGMFPQHFQAHPDGLAGAVRDLIGLNQSAFVLVIDTSVTPIPDILPHLVMTAEGDNGTVLPFGGGGEGGKNPEVGYKTGGTGVPGVSYSFGASSASGMAIGNNCVVGENDSIAFGFASNVMSKTVEFDNLQEPVDPNEEWVEFTMVDSDWQDFIHVNHNTLVLLVNSPFSVPAPIEVLGKHYEVDSTNEILKIKYADFLKDALTDIPCGFDDILGFVPNTVPLFNFDKLDDNNTGNIAGGVGCSVKGTMCAQAFGAQSQANKFGSAVFGVLGNSLFPASLNVGHGFAAHSFVGAQCMTIGEGASDMEILSLIPGIDPLPISLEKTGMYRFKGTCIISTVTGYFEALDVNFIIVNAGAQGGGLHVLPDTSGKGHFDVIISNAAQQEPPIEFSKPVVTSEGNEIKITCDGLEDLTIMWFAILDVHAVIISPEEMMQGLD